MTQDELISAYINGQLSERERAALELRLREDAALRRDAEATRFAIHAAQQLPVIAVPRNFTLPASMAQMAQPERARFDWRWVFRIGSAIAAGLFVLLIGLDLSRLLPRPTLPATPAFSPIPKEAPRPTLTLSGEILSNLPNIEVVSVPSVAGTQPSIGETTSPLPQSPRGPQPVTQSGNDASSAGASSAGASSAGAEAIVTAPQARATKSLNTLSKLTPTSIATAIPTVLQPATVAVNLTPIPIPIPIPTAASVLPTDVTSLWATLPRLLAGLMLVLGVGLAFLGWRKV